MTPGLSSRVPLGVALMVIACPMPTAHADAYSTEGRFEEYRVRAAFLTEGGAAEKKGLKISSQLLTLAAR